MIKCTYNSVSLPKQGNLASENEDNILKPSKSNLDIDNLAYFAISDGATESSFSKEWSDILVCSYTDKAFNKDNLSNTIKLASDTWKARTFSRDLPWYAEQKAEIGAFATFLGLTINLEERFFESIAIGDCTLFHIRNDEMIFSFPITSVDDFGNTPNLIASNEKYQTEFEKTVTYCNRSVLPTDYIILATDAIALWIFKHQDSEIHPWTRLSNLLDYYKSDFENWLNNERKVNKIKNDDISLIIIKFE
jgi:hypothetical protein